MKKIAFKKLLKLHLECWKMTAVLTACTTAMAVAVIVGCVLWCLFATIGLMLIAFAIAITAFAVAIKGIIGGVRRWPFASMGLMLLAFSVVSVKNTYRHHAELDKERAYSFSLEQRVDSLRNAGTFSEGYKAAKNEQRKFIRL